MKEPSGWSLMILRALQDKKMYEGTVSSGAKRVRRARNKRARKARAISRGDARG